MPPRCALMSFLSLFLFSLAMPAISRADLLVNGGFEFPSLAPGGFITVEAGTEPVGFGWSIASGNVDVGRLPNAFIDFLAPEGQNGLDLNGTERGSVFQDFVTSPGTEYSVEFLYSDNPAEGGVSSATVAIMDVGSSNFLLQDSVFHSTATNGTGTQGDGNGDVSTYFNQFTATGSITRLMFTSTSLSNTPSGGILLDGVAVSVVPEPSSILFFVSLAAVNVLRRRRPIY